MIHPDFFYKNERVNEGVNEGVSKDLTEKEQMILNAMKRTPSISVAKMVKELNISKASIERAIKSMKEKQLIVREGSAKSGKWIVL